MRQLPGRSAKKLEKKALEYGIAFQAKPLRFVFIRVRREANQIRDLRKNPRGRIRKWNRFKDFQLRAFAERDAAGAPVALLVQSEHDGALGVRRVEGAGGMAQVMFEVQDAQFRRFPEHFEEAAVIEFAPQLPQRLGLIVAAGNRRERREFRAHPRLPHPRAHGTAGHGHAFDAAPIRTSMLQTKPDRFARNPGSRAPPNQLALLHGSDDAIFREQRSGGIVTEPGKAENVHASPCFANRRSVHFAEFTSRKAAPVHGFGRLSRHDSWGESSRRRAVLVGRATEDAAGSA